MRRRFLAGASLWLLLLANTYNAAAQTMMNTSTMTLGIQQMSQNAFLSNSIFNSNAAVDMMRQDLRRKRAGDKDAGGKLSTRGLNAGKATRSKAGNALATDNATVFRSVADSIVPKKLAAQASTPEARRKLAELFAICLSDHKSRAQKAGTPLNDVTRAISFFIATAYNVAANARLTAAQVEALRADVRQFLQTNQDFQAASDRQKQETYETMVILGEYVALGYVIGLQQKNQEIQRAFQDVAKDQLERFLGTSVKSLKFTEQGIEF